MREEEVTEEKNEEQGTDQYVGDNADAEKESESHIRR
jgi:hypothetical protein